MEEKIRQFIVEKLKLHNWSSNVIGERVFELLRQDCVLLLYPLMDDGIEGCHIIKPIGDEQRQFVFINSRLTIQEQVWTAGHELGHVWKVDQVVDGIDAEKAANKFAAELLMPRYQFQKSITDILSKTDASDNKISKLEFIELVLALMNMFEVPEKAIVRRLVELGYIEANSINLYLQCLEKNRNDYERIKAERGYDNIDRPNIVSQIGNLEEDLMLLEERHIVSDNYTKKIREKFAIDSNGTELFFNGTVN